jgi:hypothetical protein
VGPPASLFFVMIAAIGGIPLRRFLDCRCGAAWCFLGGLLASVIAFVYSLIVLRLQGPLPGATFTMWCSTRC